MRALRSGRGSWKLRRRAAAWLLVLAVRSITTKSVRFLARIEDTRQRIYFANHTSHLDFILIWSSLPRDVRERTRPVAGRDYWERNWFRRYFVRKVFDAVLIDRTPANGGSAGGRAADRHAREAVDQMLAGLGDEHSLILFPEGTRGSGEALGEFRSGLYYVSRERPDVELVPVRIQGASRVLPKGRVMPRPQESELTFGQPMHLEEGEKKAAFIERARAALRSL